MNTRQPEPSECKSWYQRYIDRVPETDIVAALDEQCAATDAYLRTIPASRHDHRYAPDKWTIREVVGHVLDTERIFGFRLLTFARGDAARLSTADQDLYVRTGEFGRWPLESLIEQLKLVRQSHVLMIRQFPDAAWDRTGIMGDTPTTVRAIAFIMLGHERHHLAMIKTTYLGGT